MKFLLVLRSFSVVGIIILSFISVFDFQASDKKETFSSLNSGSSAKQIVAKRFSNPARVIAKVSRRFTPTRARSKIMPAATSESTFAKMPKTSNIQSRQTPNIQPRRVVTSSTSPKIYLKSQAISNLFINWLDDNSNIVSTIKIPKNPNIAISVPDQINYFNIANDTESLKSDKLRIVDKKLYTITCAKLSKNNNCLKLQIESSSKLIKRNILTRTPVLKKNIQYSKIPKNADTVFIDNNTGKQLQISWLTKRGKLISDNKSLTSIQGNKEYEKPNDAAKFQIVRDMSMYSNIVSAINNGEYQVTCTPSNFFCNKIVIINKGVAKNSDKENAKNNALSNSANALNLYVVNTTRNPLLINWFDINGKLLSNSKIANNLSQQKINIISNVASFQISNLSKNVFSNSVNPIVNEIYKIACQPISNKNKTCTQITVTDNGSINKFKVTRSSPMFASSKPNLTSSSQSQGASGFASDNTFDGDDDSDSSSSSDGDSSLDALLPDYSADGSISSTSSSSSDGSSASSSDDDAADNGSGN